MRKRVVEALERPERDRPRSAGRDVLPVAGSSAPTVPSNLSHSVVSLELSPPELLTEGFRFESYLGSQIFSETYELLFAPSHYKN